MQRKTIVKHRIRTYLASFFAVALLMISVFLIISSLNIKTTTDIALLNYNEKSNLDYKVYLKENDYFKEEFLPKNRQYIASIIDYIDVFYNFDFSSSKPINAKYNYKIIATLSAQYKVDTNSIKQVWSNDYVLVDNKEAEIKDQTTFSISENVKVDYDKYNQIINNFKKDYMLSVTSDLTVSMLVEVNGEYVPAEKVFNTNSEIKLTIPLSEQTIDIKMDYKDINNNQVLNIEEIGRFNNLWFFFLGTILLLVAIIIIIFEIKRVIREDKKQSKYIKQLKRILHDYGDIIVEVKNAPDIPKGKASEVKSFSELVNAQIEVRSPIVFAEISKNELGLFVLFDKEYAYYYYLSASSSKKKGEA